MKKKACIVVFSGGQDSTTCLFWARKHFEYIHAVTFDYGQRHRVELEAAQTICKKFDIEQTQLTIDTFTQLGGNSLTDQTIAVEASPDKKNLPNSFVPGRNLIFLTYAAALGWKKDIYDLVTGVCQVDYSGYPDCRANTMQALQQSISLGMDSPFQIHTPLLHLSKAQSIVLAQEVGALEALAWSHTCYNGQVPPCGKCPACQIRARGFQDAQIPDPLLQRLAPQKT